jgi:DNA polymerase (family 10)
LGTSTISELSHRAKELGYEYIGLTEHNPSVSNHTVEQITEIIKMKTKVIHNFNLANENKHENILYVFNGLEIDIQADGTRALPDSCLDLLDYACVSIHSSFNQSRKLMTARVISGLDHPKIRFFAHPTARLLLSREGIDLDWDTVFDFCVRKNKWLEINAWPDRLDLPDNLVREAISNGVRLVINTDSHAASQLSYMHYGVSVARRGWATAANIINTQTLTKMRQLLSSNQSGKAGDK